MIKEEEIIRQHDSGQRPFTTPEGYFDSFTSRLMERMEHEGLLEQPAENPALQSAKVIRLNPMQRLMRYAAAAVVAGVCVVAATYLYNHEMSQPQGAELADYVLSNDDIDELLDYEVVNNSQIAYYLTEAY